MDYLTKQTKSYLDKKDTSLSAEGKNVVVIGGGDTGADCVATAIRQGAKNVRQLAITPAFPQTRLKVTNGQVTLMFSGKIMPIKKQR